MLAPSARLFALQALQNNVAKKREKNGKNRHQPDTKGDTSHLERAVLSPSRAELRPPKFAVSHEKSHHFFHQDLQRPLEFGSDLKVPRVPFPDALAIFTKKI